MSNTPTPPLHLYIIHISTVPAMQSSFACEAGRGGLRKGGVWVRSREDKRGGGLGSVWMDERCETRAGQCSDARLFAERLIFLVLCAPVQAGLLEQHMQPCSTARGTGGRGGGRGGGGGGRSSAIVYCGHEVPGHFKTIADEISLFLSPSFLSSILSRLSFSSCRSSCLPFSSAPPIFLFSPP